MSTASRGSEVWLGLGVTVASGCARNSVRDFDHRRLDAYQVALEFVAYATETVANLPRGNAALAEQLKTAAASICLNIAEGAGEYRANEKARFYRMARRSATECAAALDVIRITHELTDDAHMAGDDLLRRIVAMLTKMSTTAGESSTE